MGKLKEEALGIFELFEEGFTPSQIADRTGHTLDFVYDSLKLFGCFDYEDEYNVED